MSLIACFESLQERRSLLEDKAFESTARMANLRQRVHEIQWQGDFSEISLVLLRYVADFLERCVIFLKRTDRLIGLGAFGLGGGGETISTEVGRLQLPLSEGSLLSRTVNARGGDLISAILGKQAWPLVGRPNRGPGLLQRLP